MQKLRTRLARLECWAAPKREARIVLRYEGLGSERFPQPTQQEMEQYPVITLRFVAAKDGRPLESTGPKALVATKANRAGIK